MHLIKTLLHVAACFFFDSATAKVSDVIDQIVISATDPSLLIQTYETLTDLQGIELVPSKLIAEYIDSAGVVLAVPSSIIDKGEAVVKQANTILTNPKVHNMPTSSGLEIADLPSPNAASTFPTTSPMIVGQELENTENIVDFFSTRRAFGTNHPVSYTRKEWEQDERKHNLASKLRAINKREINDKLQIEIQNDDPQAEFGLPSNGLES